MSFLGRLFDKRKRLERENAILQLKLKNAELKRKLKKKETKE